MNGYVFNPACSCQRCWWRRAMGPAMVVTLGVLFLLSTLNIRDFHYTWPVLLIVVGVVKIMQGNASTEGHVALGSAPPEAAAAAPPTNSAAVAPPPGGEHV